MSAPDPLLSLARGDVATARALRDALEVLREHGQDPGLRRAAQAALKGDVPLVSAFDAEATAGQALGAASDAFAARWELMSPEEQERAVAEGEQVLERYREE